MKIGIGFITFLFLFCSSPHQALSSSSTCYGTPTKGRLEGAELLPKQGKNFSTYSYFGSLMGRTAVHSRVRKLILETYAQLAEMYPEKKFVYGETGWRSGGSFKPHKTHQNGLSVDFMVPVVEETGRSVPLPAWAWNKWGYGIEFTGAGRYKNYRIDYEAMAAHLYFLNKIGQKHGVPIRRVIFAPKLQKYLKASKYGREVLKNLRFSRRPSWVRHDEHYHVDFGIPCRPL